MFSPFEVTAPHIIYACLGGFVVLFGMFSLLLRERLYIGEACWAFLFGVIIGPYCANIFNPRSWGNDSDAMTNTITLEFTRVVLAIGVFAIGVELPKAYMARHWKSLFFLLAPVMTWGWFVSAGLIYALIPSLSFLSSLAVAACLTPTDPILAAAVVGGKWADKHVPAHLRHLLAAESGCNDGAAFPFLFIALYLILDAPDTGRAIRDWILLLWLYQVVLGIVIGALIGFGFRHLMKFCQRHDLIDRHSYVAQYVSLAMLTVGVTTLLGSDDLLAAFACGTAFAWDGFFNRQTEESVFSSVIDLLFNVAAFVFVGAWMPFNQFQNAELTLSVWRLIVIAILIFLLRRLPIMIALYKWIPDVKTFREAVFSGHFGPIGIGAVFISTLAIEVIEESHHEHDPQIELLSKTIQPIVAFMVLCSITIHGLSIPSVSLGRRVHSVSRTWSRHTSLPDWMNQARHVRAGEDIVINRDSEMERGTLEPNEKVAEDKKRESSVQTADRRASLETKIAEPSSTSSTSDHKEETPPDGTETYYEWEEPHHRIIERRDSPGSDIEVTVLNEDGTEEHQHGIQLENRGSTELHNVMKKLKDAGHEVHLDAEAAGRSIKHEVQILEDSVKADVFTTRPHSKERSDEQDDEDGGWASDGSANEASTSALPQTTTTSKNPDSRKNTRLWNEFGRRSAKQRSSKRPSTAPPNLDSSPSRNGTDADEPRGRDAFNKHSRPSTAGSKTSRKERPSRPGTGDTSLRNQRLEYIRAQHGPPTRDVSPSRSVRFVDEEDTRFMSGSPRSHAPQRSYSSDALRSGIETPPLGGLSVGEAEAEGENAARARVTFDVPSSDEDRGGGGNEKT